MTGNAFAAITRHAADIVSRRSPLLAMGGAALTTAVTGPAVTRAGKGGKKANKKCKKQGGQCRTFFAEEVCPGHPDPEACKEKSFQCCNALARCRVAPFFDCLFTP